MPRSSSAALVLLFLLAPAARADWPHDPITNVILGAAVYGSQNPVMVPDGSGGGIIVWQDVRALDGDLGIYATRIMPGGALASGWVPGGTAVCIYPGDQQRPVAIPDGAGGVYVAWEDFRGADLDIYANRLTATGQLSPGWPAGGVKVCNAAGDQTAPALALDGAGGVFLAWQDVRSGSSRIFLQHLNGNGTLALGLPTEWPDNGLAPAPATGPQYGPTIVADGEGGVLVLWEDHRFDEGDIFITRVTGRGAVSGYFPAAGYPFANPPGAQLAPRAISDGQGGVIAVWTDLRDGESDLYASRMSGARLFPAGWSSYGVPVCTASGPQAGPVMVTDGAGGALFAWSDARSFDWDIYASRITADGVLAEGWTVDGNPVCLASGDQTQAALAADGQGGALLAWLDTRDNPSGDVYAARLGAGGQPAYGWPFNGRATCTAAGEQRAPVVVADLAADAIVVWSDTRSGGTIAAQRVDHYGVLGDPAPRISAVRDVANDQGGWVRVAWNASWLDQPGNDPITAYWVLRSVPVSIAERALAAGSAIRAGMARPGDARPQFVEAAGSFWELVATVPVLGVTGYALVTATTGDSTALGNPRTLFMVQARTAAVPFWGSPPDSGYSVDNLAPLAPAGLVGHYVSGMTTLQWSTAPEGDFDRWRVYRSGDPAFTIGPATLIGTTTTPSFVDPAGAPAAYAVTTVDVHGNESVPSRVLPAGAAVEGPGVAPLALAVPRPNPCAGRATIAFTLPAAGPTRVLLLDPAGRRVRTLAAGVLGGGAHAIAWDGRSDAGDPVRAGLYLVRLESAAGVRVARLVLTR